MKSVLKLSSSRLALVAAFGLTAAAYTPAAAADLGGDCCADLEERVAELEATTARKGNRKVSLTISGWVNEAVFGWDDGHEQNTYVGTNSLEQSRVRFVGEAQINSDFSAGYILEIGAQGNPSQRWNQKSDVSADPNPNNDDNALVVRKSNWFLKSKQFGQIAVGLNGTATYHLLDDADATQTRNFADAEGPAVYMSAFLLNSPSATVNGFKWTDVLRGFNNATPGQDGRRNVVRYDSPTFAGFTGAAAWGDDDIWDVALTYKGEIREFSVVAKVGYGESNNPGGDNNGDPTSSTFVINGTPCIAGSKTANSQPGFDCKWGGAAATIMHNPTGLYAYGGWGKQLVDTNNATTSTRLVEPDSSTWFLQTGIEQKWLPLGKTTIFGMYRHDDVGSDAGKTVSSNINFWQGGVVQTVDAAAMNLYVIYQHADGDVTGNPAIEGGGAPLGKTSLDSFQEVIAGALIQF